LERRALRREGCVMKRENIALLAQGRIACAELLAVILEVRKTFDGEMPGYGLARDKAVGFIDRAARKELQ